MEPLLTAAEAERQRLEALCAQSDAEDVLLVEVVYRGQWVRFDLSAMDAQFLTGEDILQRFLAHAFAAVSLPRPDAGSSSSSTPSQ